MADHQKIVLGVKRLGNSVKALLYTALFAAIVFLISVMHWFILIPLGIASLFWGGIGLMELCHAVHVIESAIRDNDDPEWWINRYPKTARFLELIGRR